MIDKFIAEVPVSGDRVIRVTAGNAHSAKVRIRDWFRGPDGRMLPGRGGLTVSLATLKSIVSALDRGRA